MTTDHLLLGVLIGGVLAVGAGAAYASRHAPTHHLLLERVAGAMLVLGLALVGFAFPFSD